MKNSNITIYGGVELAKECDLICYWVDLLKAIPTKKESLQFVKIRIDKAKKKYEIQESCILYSKMLEKVESQKKLGFDAVWDPISFLTLSKEITDNLVEHIKNIVIKIRTELVPAVDAFVKPKLLKEVIPGIAIDANIFINNPENISASQLDAMTESRGGGRQIRATRKYAKGVPGEFKKYIQACVSKTVKDVIQALNPTYDVLIKVVVSKETGLLYLSTFFPKVNN